MTKIAYCGQMHYFECTIPKQLHDCAVNVNFEPSDPSRYNSVLEYEAREHPDYWFFFRGEYVPHNVLSQVKGKKVWVSTEPIRRQDTHDLFFGRNKLFTQSHRKFFDYFVHYDVTETTQLDAHGFKVDTDFPLPVDLETYCPTPTKNEWDLIFLGRSNPRRANLTGALKKDYKFLHVDNGLIGEEAVRAYNKSSLGLSLSISNWPQFPHRIMNMMACGLPVVCDRPTHTEWIEEHELPHFTFLDNPTSWDLYQAVRDRLLNVSALKYSGRVMREIVEREFDAKKNWLRLIKELEAK